MMRLTARSMRLVGDVAGDADAGDVIRWALYIAGSGKTIDITTNTNFGVHLLS